MAPPDRSGGAFFARQGDPAYAAPCASAARSRTATILVILIIGFTAGPAVSLYGSPTISPVTAALLASLPLPHWLPSSIYFLSFSPAPPPGVIHIPPTHPPTDPPTK